VRKKQKREK